MANPATDFTPPQVLDGRFQEAVARHDRDLVSVKPIVVKYDPDFDVFAARTAYELRHKLLYRTDGGRNARGLVRLTGDLAKIHNLFKTATDPATSPGQPIHLNAIFYRRQDRQGTRRWVMLIRFNDSEDITFQDVTEPDEVTVDPGATRQALAKEIIVHGFHIVGPQASTPQGARMMEMLGIAGSVGYPKFIDLWVYNSEAIWDFMNYNISSADEETNPNSKRRQMTAATGGKVPFDGDTFPEHKPWRIYPFRNIMEKCASKPSIDDCEPAIYNELLDADRQIAKGFDAIIKRTNQVSSVPPSLKFWDLTPPESLIGPLGFKFYKHVVALTKQKDSLYSIPY